MGICCSESVQKTSNNKSNINTAQGSLENQTPVKNLPIPNDVVIKKNDIIEIEKKLNSGNKQFNPIIAPTLTVDHLRRHTCEFVFMPNILPSLYSEGIIDDDIMTNPPSWIDYLVGMSKLTDPNFLYQISVQKKELQNGMKKFLFTFPEPEVGTECYYAILYFDHNLNWNYFTLELELGHEFGSPEGSGLVCGQEGIRHLNFNKICKADMKEFEECVEELYDKLNE